MIKLLKKIFSGTPAIPPRNLDDTISHHFDNEGTSVPVRVRDYDLMAKIYLFAAKRNQLTDDLAATTGILTSVLVKAGSEAEKNTALSAAMNADKWFAAEFAADPKKQLIVFEAAKLKIVERLNFLTVSIRNSQDATADAPEINQVEILMEHNGVEVPIKYRDTDIFVVIARYLVATEGLSTRIAASSAIQTYAFANAGGAPESAAANLTIQKAHEWDAEVSVENKVMQILNMRNEIMQTIEFAKHQFKPPIDGPINRRIAQRNQLSHRGQTVELKHADHKLMRELILYAYQELKLGHEESVTQAMNTVLSLRAGDRNEQLQALKLTTFALEWIFKRHLSNPSVLHTQLSATNILIEERLERILMHAKFKGGFGNG